MSHRPSRRVLIVGGLVLLLLLGVGAIVWWKWPRETELERAVAMLPKDTQRVIWTDWAGVREELGAGDVAGDAAAAEEFLTEVTDRELASSSLASSSLLLADGLGFSPLAAEWEVLGQSPSGQAVVVKTEQDLDRVVGKITELGYTRPAKDALAGGVWSGGPDAIARVTGLTTYELQALAFFEEDGLIVGSDSPQELQRVVKVIQEGTGGIAADDLLDATGEPLAATVLLGDRACAELSMSKADDDAQVTARSLVKQAGGVSPLTGYVVALGADRALRVVFDFESETQAKANARSRGALAKAEDPAQYVAYPEVFRLDDAKADGTIVTLTGTVQPEAFPMSALAAGPVLLASC
ncbi:hypothetical protein [Nocardioides daejeonensis]|uniref:hypothetical protein n=1 Tax=Nocardioides daejeonensis TaxID=1046556 RepID=UPI0013A58A73|nr:hypothetical protein [Nocardioides daejeonensis]